MELCIGHGKKRPDLLGEQKELEAGKYKNTGSSILSHFNWFNNDGPKKARVKDD